MTERVATGRNPESSGADRTDTRDRYQSEVLRLPSNAPVGGIRPGRLGWSEMRRVLAETAVRTGSNRRAFAFQENCPVHTSPLQAV